MTYSHRKIVALTSNGVILSETSTDTVEVGEAVIAIYKKMPQVQVIRIVNTEDGSLIKQEKA